MKNWSKLLFVCEKNEQRSPSFEGWFKKNRKEYEVKSAGVTNGYPEMISKELLDWADRAFLMDLEQERFIAREFPEYLSKCEIIGCSDQYPGNSPQLIRIIEYWVRKKGL